MKTNGKSREPNGRKKLKTNGELYEFNEFIGELCEVNELEL